jgi:hypothetical protein
VPLSLVRHGREIDLGRRDDAHIGHFDDRDRPAVRVDDHRTVPDVSGREGVRGHATTVTTPQPIRAGSEESPPTRP